MVTAMPSGRELMGSMEFGTERMASSGGSWEPYWHVVGRMKSGTERKASSGGSWEPYCSNGYSPFLIPAYFIRREETSCDGHHLPLPLYLEALPAIYQGKHEEILKHKREDGSLFHSPSATACAFMITGDTDCKQYLEALLQRCGRGERFCWFMNEPQMLLHIEENYQDFLGAMYAVYRATHLMFLEEPELENAKTFSKKILQKGLPSEDLKDSLLVLSDHQKEIEHELKHLWLARMDHLEHRMYIERSKGYNLWIGKSSSYRLTCPNDIILLATKNFTTRQSIYRTELRELERWSKDTGLANMGFGRERTSYCYYICAAPISLPLDSEVRKVAAKCATLVTVADDFFDEHGSLDELQSLNEAVQRWEGKGLSGPSKVIFDTLDDLVCDITLKIFNQHGHDMKTLLQDFKEMKDGKLNMVPLYMKENPEANIQDSVAYIKNILERLKKQMLEIIMTDDNTEVPKEWKQIHLCVLKAFQMLYNTQNAFDSPTALLQDISMAIYEPLAMDDQRTLLAPFVLNANESNKENTGRSILDDTPEKELSVKADARLQGVNNRKKVYNSRGMPSKIQQSLYHVRPKRLLRVRCPSSYMLLAVPSVSPSPLLRM
ncbi:putative S-linalool synthase-like [Cocos nucifera]|uniref:Putative S-linalool synthase-like n=1 Tax=Cocos nucifera TaxID=13894 RepID=A0A8K0IB83_COCNU|nr:putative S-linalool synthase-like [Cocos nucifera]